MNSSNSFRLESKLARRLEHGCDFARGVAGVMIALSMRLFIAK